VPGRACRLTRWPRTRAMDTTYLPCRGGRLGVRRPSCSLSRILGPLSAGHVPTRLATVESTPPQPFQAPAAILAVAAFGSPCAGSTLGWFPLGARSDYSFLANNIIRDFSRTSARGQHLGICGRYGRLEPASSKPAARHNLGAVVLPECVFKHPANVPFHAGVAKRQTGRGNRRDSLCLPTRTVHLLAPPGGQGPFRFPCQDKPVPVARPLAVPLPLHQQRATAPAVARHHVRPRVQRCHDRGAIHLCWRSQGHGKGSHGIGNASLPQPSQMRHHQWHIGIYLGCRRITI
jgi:hypothetical protein